jgi:hypothetical protein
MSEVSLTKTRLRAGVWQAVLTVPAGSGAPSIDVFHLEKALNGVSVERANGAADEFQLSVPIPIEVLNDGVQTFVVQNRADKATLGSFAVIAGSPLDEDLRAEIDLLRAELDLLKRAFRRHCVETASG